MVFNRLAKMSLGANKKEGVDGLLTGKTKQNTTKTMDWTCIKNRESSLPTNNAFQGLLGNLGDIQQVRHDSSLSECQESRAQSL